MAAGPTPSWNLSRVYCTWYSQGTGSSLKPGSYKVTIPARITSTVDDSVVPAGIFDSGDLNTRAGSPSLDVMVPATDDPDILERGWKVVIEIKFADTSATPEKYVIDVPVAGVVNLRGHTPIGSSIPPMTSTIPIGGPSGFALYDRDGDVVDAAGNKVIGGGTGGSAGPVYSGSIVDASTVGKQLLTSASSSLARAYLGAGTSNLAIGTTVGTAKSGDYAPTKVDLGLGNVDNTADAAKPISTAAQAALNGKAAANHTHLSTGITDFNSAAQSAALQPIVQNADGSWPSRATVTTNRNVRVTWVGTLPGPVIGSGVSQAVAGRDVMDVTTVVPS